MLSGRLKRGAFAICNRAEAQEAQHHHGPGRWLGHTRGGWGKAAAVDREHRLAKSHDPTVVVRVNVDLHFQSCSHVRKQAGRDGKIVAIIPLVVSARKGAEKDPRTRS